MKITGKETLFEFFKRILFIILLCISISPLYSANTLTKVWEKQIGGLGFGFALSSIYVEDSLIYVAGSSDYSGYQTRVYNTDGILVDSINDPRLLARIEKFPGKDIIFSAVEQTGLGVYNKQTHEELFWVDIPEFYSPHFQILQKKIVVGHINSIRIYDYEKKELVKEFGKEYFKTFDFRPNDRYTIYTVALSGDGKYIALGYAKEHVIGGDRFDDGHYIAIIDTSGKLIKRYDNYSLFSKFGVNKDGNKLIFSLSKSIQDPVQTYIYDFNTLEFAGELYNNGFHILKSIQPEKDSIMYIGTLKGLVILNVNQITADYLGQGMFGSFDIDKDKRYLYITSENLLSKYEFGTTGISEESTNLIKLQSESTRDYLVLHNLPTNSIALQFNIVSMDGKLKFPIQIETGTDQIKINVESLPQGVYFLQILSNSKLISNHKFIKVS